MAKPGKIAPLAKEALASGVSVDELVAAHPELDEKALRRGYAQVKSKSKSGGTKPATGKKKGSKKARKKQVTEQAPKAAVAAQPVPGVATPKRSNAELRKFILQHGTKAVKDAIADLEA